MLSCKARLRLSGKTVRRFCISSHVVVAWRVHARQQVQVSIAMSTGFFRNLRVMSFNRYQVKVMSWFSLKFFTWNFNHWILVQLETQTCRLAMIQLCTTTRERIKDVGTWALRGPKVRDTFLQAQIHFHVNKHHEGMFASAWPTRQMLHCKIPCYFLDAVSFSRHGHAESLTLVVGLQSEPKLWPW